MKSEKATIYNPMKIPGRLKYYRYRLSRSYLGIALKRVYLFSTGLFTMLQTKLLSFFASPKQLTKATKNVSSQAARKPPFLVLYSLGNPGLKYLLTRHNMGHIVLNKLREIYGFTLWTADRAYRRSLVSTPGPSTEADSLSMMMFKSETYMNVSGKDLMLNFKSLAKTKPDFEPVLVVVTDELSLPVGKAKLRQRNASPRGHNGLKSIKSALPAGESYLNISVGIGRPESRDPDVVADYVLGKIPQDELEIVDEKVVPIVRRLVEEMLKGKHI